MRDATTQAWEIAYEALRRDAQAATAEGAVGLYQALFPSAPARTARRKPKPSPAASPTPAPAAS